MIRSRSVLIKRNWVSVQDSIENESNENSGNAFDHWRCTVVKIIKINLQSTLNEVKQLYVAFLQ